MARVKYLGSAHIRRFDKGETFNGQYPAGLSEALEWSIESAHVLDVDVPSEVLDLILEQPDFRDVTNVKRVPRSLGERLWQGETQPEPLSESGTGEEGTEASSATSPGGTTVGGSTAGPRGGRRG